MNPQAVREQYERLSELEGFHRVLAAAVEDYLKAMHAADSLEILERVVSDLKREFKKMPTSQTVYEAICEENARFGPERESDQFKPAFQKHPNCAKCDDAGWIRATKKGRAWHSPESDENPVRQYSGVFPCSCQAANPALRTAAPFRNQPETFVVFDPQLERDLVRHLELIDAWLTANGEDLKRKKFCMDKAGKMPPDLWDELWALQAKLKRGA